MVGQTSQRSLDSGCFELVSSHQQGIHITCLAHHPALYTPGEPECCGSVTSELMRFISHFITSTHLPHQGNKTRLGRLHSQPAVMGRAGVIKPPKTPKPTAVIPMKNHCHGGARQASVPGTVAVSRYIFIQNNYRALQFAGKMHTEAYQPTIFKKT